MYCDYEKLMYFLSALFLIFAFNVLAKPEYKGRDIRKCIASPTISSQLFVPNISGRTDILKSSRYNSFIVTQPKINSNCRSTLRQLILYSKSDSIRNKESQIVKSYNNATNTILNTTKFLLDDAWYIFSSPSRLDLKSTAYLCGFLSATGLIYAYDQEIYDAFQQSKKNSVYKTVIDIGEYFGPCGLNRITHPYYIGGYAVGYLFKSNRLQEMSLQLLETMLFDGIIRVRFLRKVVGRARPSDNRGPRFFKYGYNISFPSGHTANIFQLATITAYHVNHWAFTLASYSIATSVALQRIDGKSHWPSDVFFGAVYGIAISKAIIKVHERRKIKVFPNASYFNDTIIYGIVYRF